MPLQGVFYIRTRWHGAFLPRHCACGRWGFHHLEYRRDHPGL